MSDEELKKVANEVRKGIVTGVHAAKSGHPGGSLGAADIMTYLYFEEMNVDPADPRKADRDRFVLSKGHCAPGLYAVLAERGFFPKEDLETLRHIGSHLQGHPNMNDTPGVDMSTGSLGQGISAAVGMADGIFDIVSSGGTLISNGLVEVEKVLFSEAVLIANPELDSDKRRETEQLTFRFNSILDSRGMKYVLMNLPKERLDDAIQILPGMRSPTVLPLAQEGWCSIHAVISQEQLWERIERLKESPL